ncbi:hypothetical protein KXX17_006842, partial [Aspergillus fumigatus]
MVTFVTAYHKGFHASNDVKIIHRYVLREVGDCMAGGAGGEGKPGSAGKPGSTGKPDRAGKPDCVGKPDHAGKPDRAGKPDC